MVPRKKPGRRRLEIVAEPEWLDLVAQAAEAADRTISSYIRAAVNVQMRKDGYSYDGTVVKPAQRPRKGGSA